MEPRLSIGMPVYADFDGPMFTCMSIAMNNRGPFEINVVDNKPDAPQSEALKKFVQVFGGNPRIKANYIPYTEKTGTAAPKNKCVEVATCNRVVVCDSHIMPLPGVLDRLADYHDANPDTPDLLQGPIMLYNMIDIHTHFDDSWGSQMWGQWGNAWRCGCDPQLSTKFGVRFDPTTKTMAYKSMTLPQVDVRLCGNCQVSIPAGLAPHDHFRVLQQAGYKRMGREDNETIFEIPGQGMGMFSTHKDHWPGFSDRLKEFGGEEMIIHEKFRQRGGRCLCIPWFKYVHRFARNNGVQYPISAIGKLRNLIIGFQEIGFDDAPLREHFVKGPSNTSPLVYDSLWANPDHDRADLAAMQKAHVEGATVRTPGMEDGLTKAIREAKTFDELYEATKASPRDLNEHFDALKEWAADSKVITEVSKRRESSIALLGASPAAMVSYQTELGPLTNKAAELHPDVSWTRHNAPAHDVEGIDPTDFLYLDGVQTHPAVRDYLFKFGPQVRRVIAIKGTQTYGFTSEDGSRPGLLMALREFVSKHPEWTVVKQYMNQGGLAILSRVSEHKRQFPPMVSLTEDSAASNLAKAVGRFFTKPGFVELPVYEARIGCCMLCENRNGQQCGICRCYVEAKAKLVNERCPVDYWKAAEAEGLKIGEDPTTTSPEA